MTDPKVHKAAVEALMEKLSKCCDGQLHQVMLDALFQLHHRGVHAFPCCAQAAANSSMAAAIQFAHLASIDQVIRGERAGSHQLH